MENCPFFCTFVLIPCIMPLHTAGIRIIIINMKVQESGCVIVEDYEKATAYLEGSKISYSFFGKQTVNALKNISFQMQYGTINAIIGESGSGKSTLLKIIYGLLETQSGHVRVDGHRVLGPNEKLIPGHESMRLVSQNFEDLNLFASVWENVSSELSNSDIASKNRKTKAVLKRLRIKHLQDQRIIDLSGGEKQRVAIAKALITQPKILLMDEPFNQVDASFRESLQEDIRQIVQETSLTIILVSHDPAEVLSLADKLFILKQGRVVASGPPQKLFEKPNNSYTARLLGKANVLDKPKAAQLGIETEKKILIHQHHIQIQENKKGKFYIKQIRFKGFYQEFIIGSLKNPEWRIQAVYMGPHIYQANAGISLEIVSFSEVNN